MYLFSLHMLVLELVLLEAWVVMVYQEPWVMWESWVAMAPWGWLG
jgi:hypothetical protein